MIIKILYYFRSKKLLYYNFTFEGNDKNEKLFHNFSNENIKPNTKNMS